jgi:hypothetical protein
VLSGCIYSDNVQWLLPFSSIDCSIYAPFVQCNKTVVSVRERYSYLKLHSVPSNSFGGRACVCQCIQTNFFGLREFLENMQYPIGVVLGM